MPPEAKPKFPFLLLEPSMILARIPEGRKRAKHRGFRFGRRPKFNLHQRREALQRLANGESQTDVARSYQISLKIFRLPSLALPKKVHPRRTSFADILSPYQGFPIARHDLHPLTAEVLWPPNDRTRSGSCVSCDELTG
jgi:hypothetical protein